jgi:hypothetical protein
MKKKKLTADEIADLADKGEDVTVFMGKPEIGGIHRTTLDLGKDLMFEIDYIASSLNMSRQAVNKLGMQDYVMRWKNAKQLKIG